MIIEQEKHNVESSNSGKTTEFKIVANAHAFRSLSGNYIDKVSAVIRELSCNAVDAHKECGISEPVEVHLPTSLESYFSVRDYGRGLSEDGMREVFTTYFYSTKTESNEYIGGLGLGSKSPFCLDGVSSFSVTSIHNSVKSEYCCYVSEEGTPQISLLGSCPTKERSGLNVTVMINKTIAWEFDSKAINIYQYFDFPVKVNIAHVQEQIEIKKNNVVIQGKNFTIRKSNGYYNEFYAVMGGVAYKIPITLLMSIDPNKKDSIRNLNGYMNFNIGDLSFDIGRENLLMDKNTESKVRERFTDVIKELSLIINNMINAKPTIYQKIVEVNRLSMESSFKEFIPKEMKELSLKECKEPVKLLKKKRSRGNVVIKDYISLEIPIERDSCKVEYFLKKPKSLNKMKDALRNSLSSIFVILTEKQIEECGIDIDVVKDPDTIPSINVKSSSVKFDCYELVSYYKSRNSWKKVLLSSSSEEHRYYVVVKNLEITGKVKEDHLAILHNDNPFKFTMPKNIYGLTESFIKSEKFNSNEWISLDYYVETKMSQILSKEYYVFNNDIQLAEFLLDKIVGGESEFSEFKEAFSNYEKGFEKIEFIYRMGHKIKNINNLATEEFKKILDKYPMLAIINPGFNPSKSAIKIIKEYVGIYDN